MTFHIGSVLRGGCGCIYSVNKGSSGGSGFSSMKSAIVRRVGDYGRTVIVFRGEESKSMDGGLFFRLKCMVTVCKVGGIRYIGQGGRRIVLPSSFSGSFMRALGRDNSSRTFTGGVISCFVDERGVSVGRGGVCLVGGHCVVRSGVISRCSRSNSGYSSCRLTRCVLFCVRTTRVFNSRGGAEGRVSHFGRRRGCRFSGRLSVTVGVYLSFFSVLAGVGCDRTLGSICVSRSAF